MKALSLLKPCAPPFRVRVAGEATDDGYLDHCLDYCIASGLADRISLGHVHPVEEFLHSVDLLVLPSSGAEAFPRAVLEAMACGKPVVVARLVAAQRPSRRGARALWCPPRLQKRWRPELARCFADESLRDQMGACGRGRAETLFDVTQNAIQTARVYVEVLECS